MDSALLCGTWLLPLEPGLSWWLVLDIMVKNLGRLLSSQVSSHNGKHHFCLRCFNPFWTRKSLIKHQEYCNEYEAVKIELPGEGTMLKFKNYCRSEKVPFIVVADFESYYKPMQSCEPNPESSYTKQYQKHEPSSFCYYIIGFDDEVYKPKLVSYTGEDAAQKFLEMLEEDIKIIANIPEKKMIFGKEEKERFDKQTKCWMCNEEFNDDDVKVRDHCHFTGRYRGAAHNSCNLKCRKPNFTPVVFHNLSGYDSHLFIKKILVLVQVISIVFPTMKKGILASLKEYRLGVIRTRKEKRRLYIIK